MSNKCLGVQRCSCVCKDKGGNGQGLIGYPSHRMSEANRKQFLRAHEDRRGHHQSYCGTCGHDQAEKPTKPGGFFLLIKV